MDNIERTLAKERDRKRLAQALRENLKRRKAQPRDPVKSVIAEERDTEEQR